jgi:hypothetical protein
MPDASTATLQHRRYCPPLARSGGGLGTTAVVPPRRLCAGMGSRSLARALAVLWNVAGAVAVTLTSTVTVAVVSNGRAPRRRTRAWAG